MMHTTRRKALCFLAGASVAPAISLAAHEDPEPETQEEKCARLLMELMAECRKLPLPLHTRFGRNADIPLGKASDYARYGYSEDDGEILTIILKSRNAGLVVA